MYALIVLGAGGTISKIKSIKKKVSVSSLNDTKCLAKIDDMIIDLDNNQARQLLISLKSDIQFSKAISSNAVKEVEAIIDEKIAKL